MADQFVVDVLICGAGAAGLTLAIDLARRGVSFRLIDKLEDSFPGSRGKGVQPRSLEVFEDLGIVDRIAAAGGAAPPHRKYQSDGQYSDSLIVEDSAPTPSEPYRSPLLVPQFLTERVMRERLSELGHRPFFGCELQGFEEHDAGMSARVSSKGGVETLRVRYLVGTDGGRSFVRHALGIEFPGKTLGLRAIVADVVQSGLSSDVWHSFNSGSMERAVALCPLRGTGLFQFQAFIPHEGDVDLSAEGLTALLAERTRRDDIRIRSVSWASAYHMNARLADRYRVGRTFLAGDAAHIHPPSGGQGLNTSVQDAYNLGWKLAAVLSGAPDALLDTYEEERRPIAAEMLGLTTKLLDALKSDGNMRRGREVHQLDLGYRGFSLALHSPGRDSSILAGDRAPDAPLKGAAGQSIRLFDLFQGPHWTLLGYHADRPPLTPRPNLHIHRIGLGGDIVGGAEYIQEAYAVNAGDWILVRPDGYIAAILSSDETTVLADYIK